MTLRERLERFKPDTMIYLGSIEGSSFFLIDYCENVLGDMDKLNERYGQIFEQEVVKAYRRTVDIPGAIVLISGNIVGRCWFYGDQPGKEKQNESKTKRRVQNK
ncbi:MAG: hypothetical protein LUD12_02870 [Lachnospiraceae bacterium]|nr:hypothetical protein [Lachnospiraceae bacterium]